MLSLSSVVPTILAQTAATAADPELGWLTSRLLRVTLSSAEWVLWLLASLSVISIAFMLERFVYFRRHGLSHSAALSERLSNGDFDGALRDVGTTPGLEAAVIREGIASAGKGADSVEQVIAKVMARERPRYERFLSFLGTLGNNAPFVGLLGTVLGIIKAFNDLGQLNVKGAAIQQTVMRGISEALVATAVGLAVAIPAVVAFNAFNRWLKTITARANAHGHAIVSFLKAAERVPAAHGRPDERIREVR